MSRGSGGQVGETGPVELTYHHGLGNDFLVAFVDEVPAAGAELARRLCARPAAGGTVGAGADGLVVGTHAPGGRWTFTLFNSDGSRAEVSGNGLRCFGHAILRRTGASGGALDVEVDTAAGPRRIRVEGSPDDTEVRAAVEMGSAGPGPAFDGINLALARVPIYHAASTDLGNPHLVLVVDNPDDVDLAVAGPALEAFFAPIGCNIHFVAVDDRSTVQLRPWERGAGITKACGSGACASALLLHALGLVDDEVEVVMLGGSATVVVGDPVVLTGPSVRGDDYVVDPDEVLAGG